MYIEINCHIENLEQLDSIITIIHDISNPRHDASIRIYWNAEE